MSAHNEKQTVLAWAWSMRRGMTKSDLRSRLTRTIDQFQATDVVALDGPGRVRVESSTGVVRGWVLTRTGEFEAANNAGGTQL